MRGLGWVVAVVNLGKQQLQGVVEVRAVAGLVGDRGVEDLIAQAIQAVALHVLGRTSGQDGQLRGGLREQQEQDAVQVAQGLAGQFVAVDLIERQVLLTAAREHVVADNLDRLTHRITQITRHLHRML